MKYLFIILTTIFMAFTATNAIAGSNEHNHDHGHVEHYEGKKFETYQSALMSLKKDIQKISIILKTDTLNSTQLEEVHEISYGLEDAIEVIAEKQTKNAENVDVMKIIIENVHNTSEDHEETELREQFSKLKEKANSL